MRTLLLIFIGAGLSATTFGQQLPQFSQYARNQYAVNPGAAGVYDYLDITLGGRMQWVGFENAPMTTYLYASTPLSKKYKASFNPGLRTSAGPVRNAEIETGKLKHAVGGMLIADQYGAFRQLKIAGTYALHIPVANGYNLSFGTNVGLSNRSFLRDRAQTLDMLTGVGTDATYNSYLSQEKLNTIDIAAGLYFYSKNLFVGVSADQLTKDYISIGSSATNFDPNRHFNFTAGYKFPLSDDLTLMPTVLAKYMLPAPMSVEGTLQLEYKEWIWMAFSYRNNDAAIGMLGLNISERFKFGYSYDFSVKNIGKYNSGGHEIVLGLMLNK